MQMNFGIVIYGEFISEYFDVFICCLWMNFCGQLIFEFFVYVGFGNNNFNYCNNVDF